MMNVTRNLRRAPWLVVFFLAAISCYLIFSVRELSSRIREMGAGGAASGHQTVAQQFKELTKKEGAETSGVRKLIDLLAEYRLEEKRVFGEKARSVVLSGYAGIRHRLNSVFYRLFFPKISFMPAGAKYAGRSLVIERSQDPFIFFAPVRSSPEKRRSLEKQISFFNEFTEEFPQQGVFIYNIVESDFSDVQRELTGGLAYAADSSELLDEFERGLSSRISYASFKYDLAGFRKFFFKTDHHWAMQGAYQAYKEIVDLIKKKRPEISESVEPSDAGKVVSADFRGTFSKVAYFMGQKDEILDYAFELPPYQILFNGHISLPRNDRELLLSGDKVHDDEQDALANIYGKYFGQDYGYIRYSTGREGRKLLIFSSSFSNCMEHLFVRHYDEVHVIDLRHFQKDTGHAFKAEEFLRTHPVDDVLFLFEVNVLLFGHREFDFSDILTER